MQPMPIFYAIKPMCTTFNSLTKTSNLMKKANFSLVLTSLVFLLFLGVQSASAQASLDTDAPLDSKVITMTVNDANLISEAEAIELLSGEMKNLQLADQGQLGATAEVNSSVRIAYYDAVVTSLIGGAGLNDALSASTTDLLRIINRYKADFGISAVTIFQETVGLLEQ